MDIDEKMDTLIHDCKMAGGTPLYFSMTREQHNEFYETMNRKCDEFRFGDEMTSYRGIDVLITPAQNSQLGLVWSALRHLLIDSSS